MPKFYPHFIQLIFLFLCSSISAQTTLYPGDIAVLGVATDMGGCGLPAESDEISFVCFQDIQMGTVIDITDNGWEVASPGFWGDSEGTLRIFRIGATVPKGTVITLHAINNSGVWNYTIVSPNIGWSIIELNIPGGPFNLEPGGDQIYFMQGGTWDNQGGGMDQALYNGQILFGFNTLPNWSSDGTTHQSNLHSMVSNCFHMEAPSAEYYKYKNPFSATHQLDWIHRIQDPTSWGSYPDCASYTSDFPVYANGYSIDIDDIILGTVCAFCDQCPPYPHNFAIWLPPGYLFDVVYTNGIDTFYLYGIENFHIVSVIITDTVTYWLLSVTEVGGCPIPPIFSSQATFNAPHNNAGTHYTLFICPDFGIIPLGMFLGPHDPGGTWYPPLDPLFGIYYSSFWGPGTYHYVFLHDDCPPDSASVTVYWVDPSESTMEISCDQNGTPYDITDDRIVITLNFMGPGLGPDYHVSVLHLGLPSGSITPTMGITGVPTVFILDPGTATGSNLTLLVQDNYGQQCDYKFPITIPGFCSDPCDPAMAASISGDDEICLNNCPDNPAIVYVDISGGEESYKMDFSVSAAGYPVWNFTGVPIEQNAEIEICMDNVPSPVYDEATGVLIIPQFLVGSDLIITLLNVYGKYDCTAILDNDQHFMTIHPLPNIATTTLALCKNIAANIDLTEYDIFISPFLDVTWYDGNPLEGGDEINNPTGTNLENVVQLWAHVADDFCENAIQVPFTILPLPKLDSVPPLQICDGSAVVLQSITLIDQGNSMPVYTFHQGLPPDSTNILDPLYYPLADTTTIYVLATAGMCYDTLPIEINVQDYPDFLLQATPCDLLLNTYSILFTSSADSIHASVGMVVNNPIGQDAVNGIPNDTSVTIEIINPSGLCKDTFLIVAPNCNCPLITQPIASQPSYAICEGDPIPVLSVNVVAGLVANWYDVPSGGVPLLQNSLTYQPASATSAIYYVEALDPSNSCYSIRTEINFVVNPEAVLQTLADPELCETETIDFNSLIPNVLNGVGGNGQWFDLTTQLPVSGVIQPQNGDAWYYLFTSAPGSCLSSDTIHPIVNPLPAIDLFNILCIDAQLTYQISFTSDANIILASTGNLTQTPGTDSFLLSDIPFDTDIHLDLQYTGTGCSASIFQAAPDCSCPPLLQNNGFQLCSDQGVVDLSTFQGFGVTGNWQLVSTPPGSNPATLNGSNFQGQNSDPGLYGLRFIRSVILADCIDTASFQLQINESPFVNAGSNAVVCAPDPILLSGNVSGDNIVFNWQENGTGVISNPNALNTGYTPTLTDISAGSVSFTLTANDQTGFCPSASETITITIDGTAYFILNAGSQIYCDTSDIQVDFDDLISFGNTSGEWFFPDTVSAPIVGSSIFNPTSLAAGNYTVFYTSTNAVLPCKNDTVGVNLIIEDCSCPSVALSIPGQGLCSDSGVQDLNDFLLTTEPGTWSIVGTPAGSKPAVLNGTQFVTNNSDDGIYRLRFTLNNPITGCDDFSEINFEVIPTPSLQVATVECADDLQSWEAVVITSAGNLSNTQGNLISLGNDRYLIDGLTLNTNVQVSASNGNGLCTSNITIQAPDCECTLSISNLPDIAFLCPNETVTFDATVTGGKGSVTEFWIVANDSMYQNTLVVGAAGIYKFVSFDELGCKQEKLIDVNIYTEMVPDASVVDITCPGDQDGQIILYDILGGNGPFFISINGGNMQPISSFPYNVNGLSAGIYKIELLDGFSCSISFNLMVASVSAETLDLGPDKTILVGDSVLINPLLSFNPDSFYWTGDLSLINPLQLDNWIKPEEDQLLLLFALDNKGCLYSDDLKIKVLLHSSIYIPTIFSPNDDDINDLLAPMSDPSVTVIEYFEIFSRWGELVYAAKNFAPNQTNVGWDGTLAGKNMMPGVFVYRLSAINKKGKVLQQTGNITLIR